MTQPTLFALLAGGLEATIRDDNAWWRGERIANVPAMRRWAFAPILDGVRNGLTAATVLRGPRQVGKTSLMNQVIQALLDEGVAPKRIFRLQFDELPQLKGLTAPLQAESIAGYFLRSIIGLDVAHFPERGAEPEVDYVLTVGEQRIPLEVKYRRHIDYKDTIGMRSFMEKAHYNAPFGVLVTLLDEPGTDDPRIISIPLSTLLLLR